MKRSPEKVLNSLTEHSKDLDYKLERLYRILFNEEMYYVAYQRIYAKPGNMTAGSDGKTIDQMSLKRIEKLMASLKDESYQPQPSRRVYIPKKNGKTRPLGVPTFDDKLVQEIVRMVLDAIYEGQFENVSHGFRPKRSSHTALTHVKNTFSGVKWFVEGDIKGFFDNINHQIMINTLKKRIADERLIRLIRKFRQGERTETLHCKQSISLENKRCQIRKKIKVEKDQMQKAELIKQLKANQKENLRFPRGDEMDADYRKLKYVRYADDFLIGIIGSKQDAIKIKEDITKFLNDIMALELSDEKTLITHSAEAAKFLGYEISIRKSNATKKIAIGVTRVFNKKIQLMVSKDLVRNKLLEYKVLEIKTHNGKEQWKPKSRPYLVGKDDLEILKKYNSEIRGLANYYSLANNCCRLAQFGYIMEYSMYKTFAHKYRTKVPLILKKYNRNGYFSVRYRLKNGESKDLTFYHDGFARKKEPMRYMNIDNIPNTHYFSANSLINRLKK